MTIKIPAEEMSLLRDRVRTSRQLGKNEDLVLHGGGNTSVKLTVVDQLKNKVEALYIKDSGSDLATIDEKGFVGLNLSSLIDAKVIVKMSDVEMTSYIRGCMLDPDVGFPSVETFLHAFIKEKFVDHSHADYVLMLTNTNLTDAKIAKVFGEKVLVIPYAPAGFELARLFIEAVSAADLSKFDGVILRNHGLVTWGDTANESLKKHMNIVKEAERFVKERWKEVKGIAIGNGRREEFIDFLPLLRGVLSKRVRKVLVWDNSPKTVAYSLLKEAKELCSIGPATPDMLVRSKGSYLFLENLKDVEIRVEEFVTDYNKKFEKNLGTGYLMHDPYPSVLLVKGYGLLASSSSFKQSKIIADHAKHSLRISLASGSVAGSRNITEKQKFHMEYWSLQEAKLKKLRKPELEGYIGVVTGAASGIGYVTFSRFADEGILSVGTDIDNAILKLQDGKSRFGMMMDITNEEEVRKAFRKIVEQFGGIDVVFNNAGYLHPSPLDEISLADMKRHLDVNALGTFIVTKEAFRIMKKQGMGGSFVFNVTKNVTNPGKGMTSYGSSKAFASQLSRYVAVEGGKYGIRSNVLNPDKIFKHSKIWEGGVLEDRARAKGITVDEYRRGNLLHVEVLPEHVANIVIALVKDSIFGATTGASFPVDGGIQ